MKQKGDYDAAYELYQHCLDIYPASGAALYELSQFYMYLGQERKGEQALKQAVSSDESNFWYKQTLASTMSGNVMCLKQLRFMKIWPISFLHVWSR